MVDDAFKRERENIRAKMLKYSRAVNEGKRTDEILAAEDIAKPSKSDDVLKKRFEKDKKAMSGVFEEEKKGRLGLKKDLIDVKLEEKTSLAKRLFGAFKKKKAAPKASIAKSAPKTNAQNKQNVNLGTNSPKPNLAQKAANSQNALKTNSQANSQNTRNLQTNSRTHTPQEKVLKANPQANAQTNASSQSARSSNAPKQRIFDIKIDTQGKNQALKPTNSAQAKTPALSKPKNAEPLTKNTAFNSATNSPNLAHNEKPTPLASSANARLQTRQNSPISLDDDSVKVKNTLLQGHSKATQDERNLGKNQLLFALLCIVFAVVVFVPKIYITSNIYYLSRDIAALRTQESVLSEENKELNKKLENMRFQNQILDYLE